jgi:hypothetical protein
MKHSPLYSKALAAAQRRTVKHLPLLFGICFSASSTHLVRRAHRAGPAGRSRPRRGASQHLLPPPGRPNEYGRAGPAGPAPGRAGPAPEPPPDGPAPEPLPRRLRAQDEEAPARSCTTGPRPRPGLS